MIIEKASKILQQPVCDNCLGRQFGQLLSGLTNTERGHFIRSVVAMDLDKEETPKNINLSNFHAFKFRALEVEKHQKKRCEICNDLFENLDKWLPKIRKASKKCKFSTFLVGTKLSFDLIEKEESLWERIGIDFCEPIKAEINRELGKLVEKEFNAKFDPKNPDVNIIIDYNSNVVSLECNPLFIYGEYQKLVRGIPQTKWPSGKYTTSVEQIIAKPFMKATGGSAHKLHGAGREDIDARCLGWRPFVLEILSPQTRKIDITKLVKKIDKKVRVRKMRLSNMAEVRKIKESRAEKTYRALVVCEKTIEKNDLKKLLELESIKQRTPERVLHRRPDKYRTRKVISLKAKYLGKKKFILEIRGEAGLYIKELVSGDNGRTEPSVSSVLGLNCVCKELDVLAIHQKD